MGSAYVASLTAWAASCREGSGPRVITSTKSSKPAWPPSAELCSVQSSVS